MLQLLIISERKKFLLFADSPIQFLPFMDGLWVYCCCYKELLLEEITVSYEEIVAIVI